jgi:peptidoglycan/LPS O-acetylase OafA/YrhL
VSTIDVDAVGRSTAALEREGFRGDIEGLRALSIIGILLFHAGVPFIPGGFVGVDVFFVLSGYLITGLILREVRATGGLHLAAFWGRRARRLLPAAGVVLLATGLASIVLLPSVGSGTVAVDIVAAAVYSANLVYAHSSADYFTDSGYPSPVLHFWSLGVEEQFYLVWPVLLLACVALVGVRRSRHPLPSASATASTPRAVQRVIPVTAVVLTVVLAGSFWASLRLTETNQPWAFFLMPTRAWEFAVGGLACLAIPFLRRVPMPVRALLGWAGLGTVVVAMVRFDGQTPYPGTAALLPVLGTLAVVVAGMGPIGWGPGVLFSLRPMRATGRVSYSWYLWHWPVLILLSVGLGLEGLGWSVALVAASWIPAYLAYRYVEDPVRRAPWAVRSVRRSLQVGLIASLLGIAGGVALAVAPTSTQINAAAVGSGELGSRLAPRPGPAGVVTPTLEDAPTDLPPRYEKCHLRWLDTQPRNCVFGRPDGRPVIALWGDSHAGQWIPALTRAAKARGWRLETYTKIGCPVPDVRDWIHAYSRPYVECDEFRQAVLARLGGPNAPDAVVAISLQPDSLVDSTGELVDGPVVDTMWRDGWMATAEAVRATGAHMIVLRDTPALADNPLVCLGLHLESPGECDQPRQTVVPPASQDMDVVDGIPGVVGVDLTDGICFVDRCPAVRSNLVVFRDDDHLTATYAKALGPAVGRVLNRALKVAEREAASR